MFSIVAISELFLDPVTDMQKRFFLLVPMFYAAEDWICPPHLSLFSSGKLVVTYAFRSHVFCWELQSRPVGQIFKYHSFCWKKITQMYSTIGKHNFSMEHHILLSFTFQYRCRICWAHCNPLISSIKRGGSSHDTGISNCLLFITRDLKTWKSLSQPIGLTSHVSHATSFYTVSPA